MNCHACGTPLAGAARFCHKCGARTSGGQAAGWRGGLPWAGAGAGLGGLLTVVALRLGGSAGKGEREGGGGGGARGGGGGAPAPPPPPPPPHFLPVPPKSAPPPVNTVQN